MSLVLKANARQIPLADGSVHCCVTSPPYWALRDYGLEPEVWGGELGCEHMWQDASWRPDGWYLRSDIIWSKPNPMPESVSDRPTKSHEYLFLLAKSERYFYDADAIAEPSVSDHGSGNGFKREARLSYMDADGPRGSDEPWPRPAAGSMRNARSVWTIPTAPYSGAHFATFPPALVEPCIRAGCPEGGIVLDPFGGSGVVAATAFRLGRRFVHVDLKYHELARERIPPMAFVPGIQSSHTRKVQVG